MQRAEKEKDARKLTLLGLEASGFPWESTGLRAVGRAQLLIKRYGAAKTAWESLRKLDDYDLEANTALANIYQRLEDLTSSDQALERALTVASEPADIAEIHGQLGRNKKDRWMRSWCEAPTAEAKARKALDSPLLMEAYEQYLAAYRQDLDSYYPGLNALFLAIIILDLAGKYRMRGRSVRQRCRKARSKLDEITEKRGQIAQALLLRFENVDRPAPAGGADQDQWLSAAPEISICSRAHPRRAIYSIRRLRRWVVISCSTPHARSSCC